MPLSLRRISAFLIDVVLLFAILAPIGILVQRLTGYSAVTGPQIGLAIAINFSIPVWLYFTFSDSFSTGATLGKRLLKIRVARENGQRVRFARSLLRTALKLFPWELIHIFAFTLSTSFPTWGPLQQAGIILANVLTVLYLALAIVTRGLRSVHDLAAGTVVVLA